ncbi:MAG: carboxylating nicotinate-nucleotide diphosphorylase [Thermoguttaceae bacterium]
MTSDFRQIVWDEDLRRQWSKLLRLAIREDLGRFGDRTTRALVPEDAQGRALVVARQPGVLAGEPAVAMTLEAFDRRLGWQPQSCDGQPLTPHQAVGRIEGPARAMLAAERTVLNLLGRLSGIASLTREYVQAVAGTGARIYDTRKTTPGWRLLEKYAVRCGGGCNHRSGLDAAVLIKDNHLALGLELSAGGRRGYTPADAVVAARRYVESHPGEPGRDVLVEIELDRLDQLDAVLAAGPDLVLLDNMTPDALRQAVARRNAHGPRIELEASGGIELATVGLIAETGVERISVGALTHAAPWLDFGLDWQPE